MRLTVRITSSASPESRLPRLAPPSVSRPTPVAWRRSISAQSAGAEQVIIVPVSFSTQRKAGMSSFDPSRMPGLARARLRGEVGLPLGEVVAVLGEPARHRRGAAVAHRVAQHRQREPVDLEEEDPRGVGAVPRAPCRRATRWTTRSVYSSSSFVPVTTWSTIETAAIRSAASSASPNESTEMRSGSDVVGEQQRERVGEQHEQEAEQRA